MEGEKRTNGDIPSFVPVETILKEDGESLPVGSEKRGGLMMNLETRELFLSTGHSRPDASQRFMLPPNKSSASSDSVTDKQWECSTCSSEIVRRCGVACGENSGGESMLVKRGLQRERVQALRQNPSYREMERLRQRSLMQLKRQDPAFRALERERQRARMQLRRQDPTFRAVERERQRRRMQLKRRDPVFRERERAQQKTRMAVRRSSGKAPAESSDEQQPIVLSLLVEQEKPQDCCTTNGAREAKRADDSYSMQRLVAPQDLVHACTSQEEVVLLKSPYFGPPSCDPRRLLLSSQGDGGGVGGLLDRGVPESCLPGERGGARIVPCPATLRTSQVHHTLLPQHTRSTLLAPLPTVPQDPTHPSSQGVTKHQSNEECLECS